MVSLFRRPGEDLQIEIDKTVVQPGEELGTRVTVVPKGDFQARQGMVEQICTETYVQLISSQYGQHYHRKTQVLSRAGGAFMEDVTVHAGLPHSGGMRLVVPADALPTLTGERVNKIEPGISWAVAAYLDVARARDIRQSQEITVVRPAASDDWAPRPASAESRHSQCVLRLDLTSGGARSENVVAGSLSAEMLHNVGVSEVRVELVRIEKFGNVERSHTVDTVVVEPEGSLTAGQAREWSFRLTVGRVRAPTLKTDKSSVRWLVKGILARRMRPDLRVEREINVDF